MFIADPADDPRMGGPVLGGERDTLLEYFHAMRMTLEIKCAGLTPAQMAERSVPPSTMSLLGLIRHMADVERQWFQQRMAALDVPSRYRTADEPDGDFDGAVADPDVVASAWTAWREDCAFTDTYLATNDLDQVRDLPRIGPIALREVLVHMIEEYARHNGHADLLRERIDGRVGQ
jgi:uncharacterized damage-inducible protein DinB